MEPGLLPAGRRAVTGRLPLSGQQLRLRCGGYEAVVAGVGASLRRLQFDGRDLVLPFDADQVRPGYRGAVLAPWPNRVVDGRYTFAGAEHQLALTEPNRGNALHGLLLWTAFEVCRLDEQGVVLGATVEPQAGYPWRVRVESEYRLTEHGLTQQVRATNLGEQPAPFGTGPHHYLVAGSGPLDDWALTLPARSVLTVTDDRLLPVELVDVDRDASRFDFRQPRVLGAVTIDHAYTGLLPDADGRVGARLLAPEGTGVVMRWDTSCPWVQIHTADLPAGPGTPGHRAGLAVEPMTCAPDAFNASRYRHGTDLQVLDPGAGATAAWSIEAVRV